METMICRIEGIPKGIPLPYFEDDLLETVLMGFEFIQGLGIFIHDIINRTTEPIDRKNRFLLIGWQGAEGFIETGAVPADQIFQQPIVLAGCGSMSSHWILLHHP